jgi:cytochrome c-type biogenesis protein CcmH/NrfG
LRLGEFYYYWNGGSHDRMVMAAQVFDGGTKAVPHSSRLAFDLGRTYLLKLNDPKRAEDALREAVRRDPSNEFAWDYLGYAALRSGDRAYALTCWREVLKINPAHTSARDALRAHGG